MTAYRAPVGNSPGSAYKTRGPAGPLEEKIHGRRSIRPPKKRAATGHSTPESLFQSHLYLVFDRMSKEVPDEPQPSFWPLAAALYVASRDYLNGSPLKPFPDFLVPYFKVTLRPRPVGPDKDTLYSINQLLSFENVLPSSMLPQGIEELARTIGKRTSGHVAKALSAIDVLSLDEQFSPENDDDSSATLGDLYPSPDTPPDQEAETNIRNAALRDSLGSLSSGEKYVIQRRHGLDGGGGATLEVIGKEIGRTRERVRQIEAKALEKLRENKKLKRETQG